MAEHLAGQPTSEQCLVSCFALTSWTLQLTPIECTSSYLWHAPALT